MIQANELRIGNWVNEFGKDVQVSIDDFINQDYKPNQHEFEYFNPIHLTEEWLVKFGFQKMDDNWYSNENYNLERDERGFWLSSQTLQLSETFNYVHQIQNLHFALTGQELKLNDK